MSHERVVVVGSANLDHILSVETLPERGATIISRDYVTGPGGKGLNQAVACSRLGGPTSISAAVGTDAAGDEVIAVLDKECIDRRMLTRAVDAPTGAALVTVADDGSNTVVVAPGANAMLAPLAAEDITGCAVLLCQLEVPVATVESALLAGREAKATTVLNAAPIAPGISAKLLGLVDVLVVNETEAQSLSGRRPAEALPVLLELGCPTVIITLGERGALLGRVGASPVEVAPFAVKAVDTTAAGDAFCGGVASGLAAGRSLDEAVLRGCAAGALAATKLGAVASLPDLAAVEALLKGAPR